MFKKVLIMQTMVQQKKVKEVMKKVSFLYWENICKYNYFAKQLPTKIGASVPLHSASLFDKNLNAEAYTTYL